ncbi:MULTISPECIES: TetR/AcrR family transcriptional regulator [Actinomadura]|uniref:TetR/AcrR family transcriptional regulator n=1 Tax=Actinomadura yumaensis TaxID=111807 RepID=A0ABW2CHN0_9ACTN|nr:TetR/AcrR family transcriptional regulator [Actinomadura sp. J1-007]
MAGDPPGKLKGGRHGLSRDYVRGNQRGRILAAVVAAAGEVGFTRMSVETVISRAQVSRRTFYEHFRNKEEAFLAAYDEVMRGLLERTAEAYERESGIPDRFRAGLRAFLEGLAEDPAAARMCIVEVLTAGPRATARRDEVLRTFAGLAEVEVRRLAPGYRTPALTAELTIGGLYAVVYDRVGAGRVAELPAMVADLAYALYVPP